jgi:ABC-2 type transport system permease protein
MSELADRIPVLRRVPRPHLPRRVRPAKPLEVDGHPALRERIYGLGSVYGKALRDSRRGLLLAAGGIGLILFFTASQLATTFGDAISRAQVALLPMQLPPIFRGMLGEPYNVETLGGFLSWRTLNFMPILVGAWSIAALSGTLAAEAARGSLDLVGTTGRSRTSVAVQKAAAFVTAMVIACLVIGLIAWVSTVAFATLPGDERTLPDALSHVAWLAVVGLFPGAIAWLVAPVLGRGAAAGVGALVMIVSYVAHGYKEAIPAFGSLDPLSYFGWTAGHRPLAGVSDPIPVVALAAAVAASLVAGAVLFRVRDVGITVAIRNPLPRPRLGLGSPVSRSFAERLPVAVGWGLGLGALGLVFALNLEAMRDAFESLPQIQQIVERIYPGVDLFSAGGILQLVFFGFGLLIVAAAAGMLASGWASDETRGRLEAVLSVPIARASWAIRSGVGLMGAVLVLTLVVSGMIAAGTAAVGSDASTPAIGVAVLGLYAAALVGLGIAAGGLVRASIAAAVAGGLGLMNYLLDTIGTGLQLPEPILDLSLSSHLGQPMAGIYDPVGLVACAVIAVGGVLVSAFGYARRDITR